MREWSVNQVVAQLRDLGVREGGALLVHTSFKAVRPIEGGPPGLIRALRLAVGDEGTLVMPTMTDGEAVFDPTSTPADGMGITAETFWRQSGVQRSGHPGGSFAAVGPLAPRICAPQPLSPPHGPDSPPGRVYDLGGQVLLLGVTHAEDTTLHVAEAIARVPYSISHPCVVEVDGIVRTLMIAETDHCCRRFGLADAWLRERGLQREGKVANADARLCASRDVVAVAVEHLAADPLLFLCPVGEGCQECDAARATVPPGRSTILRDKTYRLLGSSGQTRESTTPGTLGGNAKDKIYGRLDCKAALAALRRYGEAYTKHRVFFATEEDAIGAGYRPCGSCLHARYVEWKQRQSSGRPATKD